MMITRGIYEDKDRIIRVGHFGILAPEMLRRSMGYLGAVKEELGLVPGRVAASRQRRKN